MLNPVRKRPFLHLTAKRHLISLAAGIAMRDHGLDARAFAEVVARDYGSRGNENASRVWDSVAEEIDRRSRCHIETQK